MRGKGSTTSKPSKWHRITPAYAGKSVLRPFPRACMRDHPRVCGEKVPAMYSSFITQGSPPRMRGKAAPSWQSRPADKDHPRVCGEKGAFCCRVPMIWGSPPRMRGKAVYNRIIQLRVGITPAYAGKSYNHIENTAAMKDHPRVCGEKASAAGSPLAVSGSPPRMRGKDCGHLYFLPPYGITPAYAGKSSIAFKLLALIRDHPRVCGEKAGKPVLGAWSLGSPPRMRGKD